MLYSIRPVLCNAIQLDPSLSVPTKWYTFFSVIQTLHWLSVSSNHLDFSVIKYAFNGRGLYSVEWFMYLLLWAYIKICLAMPLHTALTHYLFIYTLLTHYHFQHASLPDPRMERASILQLWSTSKVGHLFCADHIWKEILGLSWQCCEWRCKLVYLKFIKCWLQWHYHFNIYDLIAALVPLPGMDGWG
jgi:hypothetical protein